MSRRPEPNVFREAPGTMGLLAVFAAVFLAFDQHIGNSSDMLRAGSMQPILVARGEVWRLLACGFSHHGPIHLLFNGYFLFRVGPLVERELGSLRFLVLFLVAVLTCSIAGYFWHSPVAILAGGSGGLFGIVGAMVAVHARAGRYITEFLQWRSGQALLQLIVANLVLGFLFPMISQAGHLGGLFGGLVLTFVYLRPGKGVRDLWSKLYRLGWALLLVVAIAYCGHPFLTWEHLTRAVYRAPDEPRLVELTQAAVRAGGDGETLEFLARLRLCQLTGRVDPGLPQIPLYYHPEDWELLGFAWEELVAEARRWRGE